MRQKTVGIIDLDSGNLHSLQSALESLGHRVLRLRTPRPELALDALVLPGQGRFAFTAEQLTRLHWRDYLREYLQRGGQLVGICVGMQVLFEGSEEDPEAAGLGFLPGRLRRLNYSKLPMVGWSVLRSNDPNLHGECGYFVNSYAVTESPHTLATTHCGERFSAVVCAGTLCGFQFHPEKSGPAGTRWLDAALNGRLGRIDPAGAACPPAGDSCDLLPRIIPCLDVAHGQVVKGTRFKQLKVLGDPLTLARNYQSQGADEVVFLDVRASVDEQPAALAMVNTVAGGLRIPFTVGGGVRTIDDVQRFFDAGADKIAINTAAVLNPGLIDAISRRFGSQSLVLAVDVERTGAGELVVCTHGGSVPTERVFADWMREIVDRGAGEILLTAMHRDGTGEGFDLELLADSAELPIQVIASGGANKPADFLDAFRAGADAVLAAGIFHRNEYRVDQVKDFLQQNNMPMRRSL